MFGSQAELREHKKFCSRSHNDSVSTATTSPSLSDIEVLSDSESEDSNNTPTSPKHLSPTKMAGKGNGRKKRGQRKKKTSVSGSSSAANITAVPKNTQTRALSMEAMGLGYNLSPPDFHEDSSVGLGGVGAEGVSFDIGSDSSESSDEEDNYTYTNAEMAKLLSLNEQDMYPCSASSDSEGEEVVGEEGGVLSGEEEEGGGHGVAEGKDLGKKKRRQRGKKKKAPQTNSSTPNNVNRSPHSPVPQQRTPAHSRQPEPVGLFWDIENCSVPVNKSAFGVAAKMRRVFFEGKREAEFMVVCDITKERKEIVDALNKAQVCMCLTCA